MANGALETVFAEMVASTTPSETFATRARASFTIPGPSRTDDVALDPVGLSPSFPQPMVEPLTEVAQRLVLPGLELVPPNTVVPAGDQQHLRRVLPGRPEHRDGS